MSDKKPLPRAKFEAIVRGCMAVFKRHGFTPQPVQQTDSRFSDIFEDICFGWFGDVAPKPEIPASPKRKINLAQKQMDQMTLECALVFVQQGVKHVHYNESLNHIRGSIADLLEAMGYENSEKLCYASQPGWGCYKLWEEVARQECLEADKIVETRKWFRENRTEHYEVT